MESHYSQSASLLEVTRAAAPTRPDQDTTGLVMDVSAVDEPSRIHAFYPPTEASFAAGADVPLIQDVQDEVQLMTGHDRSVRADLKDLAQLMKPATPQQALIPVAQKQYQPSPMTPHAILRRLSNKPKSVVTKTPKSDAAVSADENTPYRNNDVPAMDYGQLMVQMNRFRMRLESPTCLPSISLEEINQQIQTVTTQTRTLYTQKQSLQSSLASLPPSSLALHSLSTAQTHLESRRSDLTAQRLHIASLQTQLDRLHHHLHTCRSRCHQLGLDLGTGLEKRGVLGIVPRRWIRVVWLVLAVLLEVGVLVLGFGSGVWAAMELEDAESGGGDWSFMEQELF